MSNKDKEVDKLFDLYCGIEHIEKDDFDDGYDDWEENWQAFVNRTKEVIYNFLTMPVKKAYSYAHKDGWTDKHIRKVEFVVIGDD